MQGCSTNGHGPTRRDLTFYRGDDFVMTLAFFADGVPYDLTGSAFLAQVRTQVDGDLLATMTVDSSDYALGQVTFGIDHSVTESDTLSGVYDVQWTDALGSVLTVLRGKTAVVRDVSV